MNTFHYIFYTGQPSVGISYWAHRKVVLGGQNYTDTGRWVFRHYLTSGIAKTLNWHGLKNTKLLRNWDWQLLYREIRHSTLSSRSKGGLSNTAGIRFILPQTGTEVGKDGPWNKCLSTRNWQFTVKFARVQNTWNYVPKMNSFLQLFSCVDLPELTFIFNSLFIVLQLKYCDKMDFNFAEWKIDLKFFTLCYFTQIVKVYSVFYMLC